MSAIDHGLPLLFVAAMWFLTTALVVWLVSRPAASFGRGLAAAGLLATVSVAVIVATAGDDGIAAAYLSFAAALAIWGWHEIAFLTGVVTGPRRTACPPDARGWRRFALAAATLIHHELALAATALVLLAIGWGQPNMTGPIAFALLFALRISAKLNIFLGVPNFADELLPARLAYLRSYFRTRPVNPFYPVSLLLAVGASAWFGQAALASEGGEAVGNAMLFALAAFGALEHLFMIMPLKDAALWRWAAAPGTTTK